MSRVRMWIAAFWPAALGVLAAHQVAFLGHDDGHIHGYLETFGPAFFVAVVLGWIWSWARARVEFRSVVALQVVLFAVMEGAERVAAVSSFTVSDLLPVGVALVLIPLAAAVLVLADRAIELVGSMRLNLVSTDDASGALMTGSGGPLSPPIETWSIRAPPSLV